LKLDPNGLVRLALPGSGQYTGTMCGAGEVSQKTIRGLCNIANQGAGAPYNNVFGWNIGGTTQANILADNVRCNETANYFNNCSFDTNTYCSHDQDLAIVCDTTKPNLFSFSVTDQNYAQVVTPGSTAGPQPICADIIDDNTNKAICGFSGKPNGRVFSDYSSLADGTPLGLNYIKCPPGATNIFQCKFSQAGACSSVLKLVCQEAPTPAPTPRPAAPPTRAPPAPPTRAPPTPPPTPAPAPTILPTLKPTTTPAPTPPTNNGGTTQRPTNNNGGTTSSTAASPTNQPTNQPTTTAAPPTATYPPNSVTFTFANGFSSSYNQNDFISALAKELNIGTDAITFDNKNATAVTVTFTGASSDSAFKTSTGWTTLPQSLQNFGASKATDSSNAAAPSSNNNDNNNNNGNKSGGTNTGAIVGGIIGALVGVGIIIFVVYKTVFASSARTAMGDDGRSVQFNAGAEYVAHEEV